MPPENAGAIEAYRLMKTKAHALILDDDSPHTRSLTAALESAGFRVQVADRKIDIEEPPHIAFLSMDLQSFDVLETIADPAFAETIEIILMAAADDPRKVRRGIANGATYFFCKPFDGVFLTQLLEDVYTEITRSGSKTEAHETRPLDQFGYLRGSSPAMHKLFRILRKVAPTDASVLLVGESGTGKELAARTLHQLGDVAAGPFVAMNSGAIPKELFESELFGHEKGSFSGAEQQHQGFFERAAHGTLFLDELTEMPIELQAKLLRVLEAGAFRRVGGETDIEGNARIVAATNRIPEDAINDGMLREDLYYRIARFPIWLPPLRNRGADIQGLARFFLQNLNTKNDTAVTINAPALEELQSHTWPGNVRELRSAIEQAYILADSEIASKHLPNLQEQLHQEQLRISVGESIEDAERKLIFATLEVNDGDKKATAETLGISLKTLYNRLNRYETDNPDDANDP